MPITTTFVPGQTIPTPANFPLRWENPQQARQLWILDNQHFAGQIPPLLASISHDIYAKPFNYGAARYALPVRLATLCMNGYGYIGLVPEGAPPDFVRKGINALNRVAPGLVKTMLGKMIDGMTQKYMHSLSQSSPSSINTGPTSGGPNCSNIWPGGKILT